MVATALGVGLPHDAEGGCQLRTAGRMPTKMAARRRATIPASAPREGCGGRSGSSASPIARTTAMRAAPAATTSPTFVSSMPPIANHGSARVAGRVANVARARRPAVPPSSASRRRARRRRSRPSVRVELVPAHASTGRRRRRSAARPRPAGRPGRRGRSRPRRARARSGRSLTTSGTSSRRVSSRASWSTASSSPSGERPARGSGRCRRRRGPPPRGTRRGRAARR